LIQHVFWGSFPSTLSTCMFAQRISELQTCQTIVFKAVYCCSALVKSPKFLVWHAINIINNIIKSDWCTFFSCYGNWNTKRHSATWPVTEARLNLSVSKPGMHAVFCHSPKWNAKKKPHFPHCVFKIPNKATSFWFGALQWPGFLHRSLLYDWRRVHRETSPRGASHLKSECAVGHLSSNNDSWLINKL
jgi:hypothetical protein